MRKMFLIFTALLLLLSGCDDRQEEIDALQAALDAYAPYEELVDAVEQGRFEDAGRILDGYEQKALNDTYLQGEWKRISVTADNWSDFFEVRELTEWCVNDLGETTGFITHVCLCLKDAYVNSVVENETSVDFGWQGTCSVKNCSVDIANRIVSIENVFSSGSTTFGAPEVLSGTVSYDGEVLEDMFLNEHHAVCEIGEIVVVGEYRLNDEMKPVCFDYEDVTVISAQGYLVLDLNGEGNG